MSQRSFTRSARLLRTSQAHLTAGVSSLVRAGSRPPLFFRSAAGSHLTDVDGNRYIDYALAWGPLILGHTHPAVIRAVRRQLSFFQTLGAQHQLEIDVSRKICQMVPCAELVTFSSSGSEPVQMALRLARAYTGRQRFVKFEGHYHGWHDNVLISFHTDPDRHRLGEPVPVSEGQSRSVLSDICILPWNDLKALEQLLEKEHQEIAAIIMEPLLGNSSCLMPKPGYLEGVRKLATKYGVVLIFDEVITGFRVATGGAQYLFGVTPDLATFGKAVAAGFPLSVIGGKRDIMRLIVEKRVLHGGTFNGNPVSLSAAHACLEILSSRGGAALTRARRSGEALMAEIRDAAQKAGIPVLVNGVGTVFHLSFTKRTFMHNYRETLDCSVAARDRFIDEMLQCGVYLLPDGRWYVSAAHSDADIEKTARSVRMVFEKLKSVLAQ